MHHADQDALVIGGGLAGAALAAQLAGAGRRVVLLEREAGPHHKVCGEFLSREAGQYLAALGVDPVALGAQAIHAVRLAAGTRIAVVDLPFSALSLSRHALDEALLRRAADFGAVVRRGARAQTLESWNGAWRARLQTGETLDAGAAFLATGKHDLRGWSRPPGVQADLVGFKLHWRLDPAQAEELAGHVELTLFPGGYAGLEPVENGAANLCLLVRRRRFAELGQNWDALLAAIRTASPYLDRRLRGAAPCWERPLAVSALPYGHVRRDSDGPWRLGDQAAVIPSFAGDGMSIAFHSARLAAAGFLAGGSAEDYQKKLAADIAMPVRLATLISLALVNPVGQAAIATLVRLLPMLMTGVARATRVPQAALRRSGIG